MVAREFCFDVKTGFYTVDMPIGFGWGWAELKPDDYTIIRTAKPEMYSALDDLRCHKKKLKAALNHSGQDNIFLDFALEAAPAKEHLLPPEFINIRTGDRYKSEDEMWDNAEDGDVVFFTKNPQDLSLPGFVLSLSSVADRRYSYERSREGIERAQVVIDAGSSYAAKLALKAPVVIIIPKPGAVLEGG